MPPGGILRIVHRFCSFLVICAFLAGVCAFSGASALAQMNTGEISGQLKDPSGATVANATIEAAEANTGLKHTATSNASGEFLLAELPVGVYKLTVTAKGFKQSLISDVTMHAGDKLSGKVSRWNWENKMRS